MGLEGLKSHWEPHRIGPVPLKCPCRPGWYVPAWIWVLFVESLPEYIDPFLDGMQVGTAFKGNERHEKIFKESWSHVCASDGLFASLCPANLGIAGSMLKVFLFSYSIPFW